MWLRVLLTSEPSGEAAVEKTSGKHVSDSRRLARGRSSLDNLRDDSPPSHEPTLRFRRLDKTCEQRMRVEGTAL